MVFLGQSSAYLSNCLARRQTVGAVVDSDALDERIAERAEAAFTFLERLVGAPSVVGAEREAQEVVAAELQRLGFAVERLEVPERIATDPAAGVPQHAYAGRYDLV